MWSSDQCLIQAAKVLENHGREYLWTADATAELLRQNPQSTSRKIGMEKGSAMGKSNMAEFFMGPTLCSQSETKQNELDWEHVAVRPWLALATQLQVVLTIIFTSVTLDWYAYFLHGHQFSLLCSCYSAVNLNDNTLVHTSTPVRHL